MSAALDLPDSPGFLQAAQTASPSTAARTASIRGQISDVNGGIVPGASVSILTSAGVGVQGKPLRQATADGEGRFVLDDLQPGTYNLRIDATGLQSFEPPPVLLKANEQYVLPDTALPLATSSQSVDVVATRNEIAEEELNGEIKQRVLGILPNFYTSYVWDAAPLSTRQKFRLTFRSLTDPWIFISTGITAGIQQEQGTYPEYGTGASGYAERYASAYGDVLAGRLIGSAILPAIFHQDPRYFYRGTGGIPRRTLHALVSSVAARSDRGGVEPNYTHTLGNFAAGYLSQAWHQGSDSGLTLALDNTLIGIGDTALHNLLEEFLYKHISTGTPRYAKGKPVQEQGSAAHP